MTADTLGASTEPLIRSRAPCSRAPVANTTSITPGGVGNAEIDAASGGTRTLQLLAPAKQLACLNTSIASHRRHNCARLHRRSNDALLLGSRRQNRNCDPDPNSQAETFAHARAKHPSTEACLEADILALHLLCVSQNFLGGNTAS
jgi:hypothetical protein